MAANCVETEFLILGAGIAGLAAAAELGDAAVVLERQSRPGGLVRTECFDGYWFDHVLHLLHFSNSAIQQRFQKLLGDVMEPCAPVAWVECAAGTARYPIQLNLGALAVDTQLRCLDDLARVIYENTTEQPAIRGYDDYLLRCFGLALCELFYFPYNRKMWKRPLDSLVPAGQSWNILRPSFPEALRGCFEPNRMREAYNTNAFYPRPPAGARIRGMEVVSAALAAQACHLQLETEVTAIDADRRRVSARQNNVEHVFEFRRHCLSTIPLPQAIRLCRNAPVAIRRDAESLRYNLVLSVCLSIKGPRPVAPGHWRYYASEDFCFTRLIFLTEFDPQSAPPDGWGLMAELTFPAEVQRPSDAAVIARVSDDVTRVDILPQGCSIIDAHILEANPAYVVFDAGSEAAAERCRSFLAHAGIATVGRYGRWEYSSMSQVAGDAFQWACSQLAQPPISEISA